MITKNKPGEKASECSDTYANRVFNLNIQAIMITMRAEMEKSKSTVAIFGDASKIGAPTLGAPSPVNLPFPSNYPIYDGSKGTLPDNYTLVNSRDENGKIQFTPADPKLEVYQT